jgi:hypothetical protein
MGLTFAEAKRLGIAHLWPSGARSNLPVVAPPTKSAAIDDGMNKLERRFWGRLEAAGGHVFKRVWREPWKLQVIGKCRWYTPDFVVEEFPSLGNRFTVFETKGYMREDASLKLIAAASRYPCFAWVLVQRDRGTWRCCNVTERGYSRDFYTPDWLV